MLGCVTLCQALPLLDFAVLRPVLCSSVAMSCSTPALLYCRYFPLWQVQAGAVDIGWDLSDAERQRLEPLVMVIR